MKEIRDNSELTELLKGDKPILLDFYADWCGPCQALLPVVNNLAEKYQDDVVIAKINIDKNADISRDFAIRSIPALFFIDREEIMEKLVGFQPEPILDAKIQQYARASV